MNDTCICDNVPKVWRLTGVTRTLRLRIFNPDGTPLDLTGRTVAVTIARDNSEFVYAPGFVIEGDDNNVVKFEWPADQQGAGDYTINVTTTDGSGNADRVNWHGPTGIRLVDFSFMVRGEDALGVTSEANIGLDGTFTMNGTGMSAYDEWLAEGHTGTPEEFIAWLRQPAVDAATEAEATVDAKMAEVDADMAAIEATAAADHTRAENDHTTATGDHTRAEADHAQAITDSQQAASDHQHAEIDAAAAAIDREKAATDRTKAANDRQQAATDHATAAQDHATASSDHQQAQSDHSTASADHTKAAQDAERAASDHTRAGDDHDTAVADHQQAENDHARAEQDHTTAAADHTTAAADHTQATADHEVMAGYDTRLGNVEGDVSQLGQECSQNKAQGNKIELVTQDAEIYQVNVNSDVVTTTGTRLRLLYYVFPGSIVSAGCSLGSGISAGVFSSKQSALIASESDALQVVQSGYVSSFSNVRIRFEGYLCLSLKKANGSSISAQDRSDLIAATNVDISRDSLSSDIENLSSFVWNNCLVGANNVYVQKDIVGLVPGRSYLLVLKTNTWDMTGVQGAGLYRWTIDSFYNGTSNQNYAAVYTSGNHITDIDTTYLLKIPENSDFVRIGARAANNEKIYFNIYDITEIGTFKTQTDAISLRVKTGTDVPVDDASGTRIRVILFVVAGMSIRYKSTDVNGAAAAVYDTVDHAVRAATDLGRLQNFSNYTKDEIISTVTATGYLSVSLSNGSTAISDIRKQEMMDSLSLSVGFGLDYKANNPAKVKMDEVEDGYSQPLQLYTTSPFMKGVNHRGYSIEAPENTLPAYLLSYKHGFRYVECDISFTSDGVPVLLHDSTIDRTSNGTGNISSLTYEQVLQYDFGSWFSPEYAGTKIPTLMEFLSLCRNLGLHPFLEIKNSASYTTEQIHEIVNLVEAYGMKGNVTYLSFNASYLATVVAYDKKANVNYIVYSVTDSVITTAEGLRTGENIVAIGSQSYTSQEIDKCRNSHFPIGVWTIDSAQTIAALDPYISSVTSNSQNAMLIRMNKELE